MLESILLPLDAVTSSKAFLQALGAGEASASLAALKVKHGDLETLRVYVSKMLHGLQRFRDNLRICLANMEAAAKVAEAAARDAAAGAAGEEEGQVRTVPLGGAVLRQGRGAVIKCGCRQGCNEGSKCACRKAGGAGSATGNAPARGSIAATLTAASDSPALYILLWLLLWV